MWLLVVLTQQRMSRTLLVTASSISLIVLFLCQESLVLFCTAVPTGARCPPVKGREAETCVCQTDTGIIDLTPIASTDGTPRLWDEAKYHTQAHLIIILQILWFARWLWLYLLLQSLYYLLHNPMHQRLRTLPTILNVIGITNWSSMNSYNCRITYSIPIVCVLLHVQ